MSTIDLQVEGMSCGSCVNHVTQALQPPPWQPEALVCEVAAGMDASAASFAG